MLLGFFSEDLENTKAYFTACCWGDSFRDWDGRNNMGGVFEKHRTAAAVFKGTSGNSCVWSITDYASFQVFWYNCGNYVISLTSKYFINTPWMHGLSPLGLLQHVSTICIWDLIDGCNVNITSGKGGTAQLRSFYNDGIHWGRTQYTSKAKLKSPL